MKEVAFFTFKNNKQDYFFQLSFFYVLYRISLNFQHTQSYYMPKFCNCYKDSAGLDRFALAALERELWPRRPVHFFISHPLISLMFSEFEDMYVVDAEIYP